MALLGGGKSIHASFVPSIPTHPNPPTTRHDTQGEGAGAGKRRQHGWGGSGDGGAQWGRWGRLLGGGLTTLTAAALLLAGDGLTRMEEDETEVEEEWYAKEIASRRAGRSNKTFEALKEKWHWLAGKEIIWGDWGRGGEVDS